MPHSENIFSRLISCPMKTTTVWGAALERLRDGRSLRSMQTSGLIGIPQYKRMCESKLGPSIAVLCGLRQAEQFTRRKSDVDTHLWAFVIPNAKHADQPKIAYIPPSAREAVQRQLQTPGPWLIPDPGNPREPFPIKRWYKTAYKRAVQAAGLPKKFNWHSLRHTFASRMLLSGASTKTVAQAGGWSSERMVADVYGHLTTQHVIEAMERAATGSATATSPADTKAIVKKPK